jgi:CxxC-x17-CxxC domain-containing protein
MREFMRDNRSSDRKGGSGFGGRSSGHQHSGFGGRPAMFQATCSSCGQACEVPFKPTGSKPVYCSNCFKNQNDDGGSRPERRSFDRPSFGEKRMFTATCSECGQKCEVPFKPNGEKPVYCSNCFGNHAPADRNVNPYKASEPKSSAPRVDQFEILNAKLDKLIKALMPAAPVVAVKAPQIEKKAEPAKIVEKIIVKPIAAKPVVVAKLKAVKPVKAVKTVKTVKKAAPAKAKAPVKKVAKSKKK